MRRHEFSLKTMWFWFSKVNKKTGRKSQSVRQSVSYTGWQTMTMDETTNVVASQAEWTNEDKSHTDLLLFISGPHVSAFKPTCSTKNQKTILCLRFKKLSELSPSSHLFLFEVKSSPESWQILSVLSSPALNLLVIQAHPTSLTSPFRRPAPTKYRNGSRKLKPLVTAIAETWKLTVLEGFGRGQG